MEHNFQFSKHLVVFFVTFIAMAFLLSYCDSAGPLYDPIEISGQVLDSETDEPIENAVVRLIQPEPEKNTVTDSNGQFFFELDVDSTVTIRVLISMESYDTRTLETVAIPERNIVFPVTRLAAERDETDPPIDDDDPDIEAGGPFSLVLSSVSSETISVKGTGDTEQAEFVFKIADSSGVPVPQAEVAFHLGSSPGGGEVVYPEIAESDSNGEVRTTLTSGTVSGTVQVIASIEREGFTVESRPVRITIHSGLPSDNHFTFKAPNPSIISKTETSEISVLLGDRHGNPVSAGTSVYFTTTGGVIDGSAQTDDNGEASVTLRYGEPIPQNGRAVITAQTTDENNQTIKRETEVLFASSGIVIQVDPASARLADVNGMRFNYTVSDGNGNPLPAGSNITVRAEGMDVELSGDVDVSLGGQNQAGPGTTEFSFRVHEARKQEGIGNRDLYFEIVVTSPDGAMSERIPIEDQRKGAASISLVSISEDIISVRETGDTEQAEFIFKVADSSGMPVHDAEVAFRLGSSPGGGEFLYPETAKSDVNGEARTTLTSGTVSGTVQVIASVQREGFAVESRPVRITVHSGLPSDDHFTLETPNPRTINEGQTSTISVLLGDRHGNPVSAGTSVYFTTTGGVIDGSGKTNERGRVEVELQYGQPIPENGRAVVTARTTNEFNQTIERQTEVLFQSTTETVTVIQANPASARLSDLNGLTFNYTVSDDRGNPLPAGTSISVTAEGMDAQLSGDVSVTLGENFDPGPGVTEFSFRVHEAVKQTGIGDRDLYFEIAVSGFNGDKTERIPVEYSPAGPASIVLSSISSETITVKGTGDTEQAEFVFQVADSSGAPVHQAEVEFSLGSSPGGGEVVHPQTAISDANGIVRTTLTSGTISGVVQVIASIQRDGFAVESRPVRVSIQSGLPSDDHFTMYRPNPRNLPFDGTSQINVMLGDRYGNPVAAGTRVYFTTDYGVIGASAVTNQDGQAGVTLRRGDPTPPDGFVTVTARTVDENNQSIERQSTVLFNTPPILIEVDPTDFFIEHLSDQTFNYTVTDVNGNPLPAGSNITVTVEGEDVEVIGDVSVTLGDHISGGQGITQFSFNVAGINEDLHENPRPVFIEIKAETSTDIQTVQIQGRKAKQVMD